MKFPSSWLKGSSLGESIASELRLHIISGAIKPGTVLSENGIASDFGASRSPVREALKTLSNEGLITLKRMGAEVNGLLVHDLEELYDVRYLIESFAWKRLADSDSAELIVQLRQVIDKMELAGRHRDVVDFAYQDLAFHETIITAANHTRIWHLWLSIRQIVMTVMLVTTKQILSQDDDKINYVVNKHRKLLTGLESKDPHIIVQNVEEYFEDSVKTLHTSIPE